MEPIVSISLPVSLNQHRSHGPIFIFVGLRYTDQNFKVRRSEKNKNKN